MTPLRHSLRGYAISRFSRVILVDAKVHRKIIMKAKLQKTPCPFRHLVARSALTHLDTTSQLSIAASSFLHEGVSQRVGHGRVRRTLYQWQTMAVTKVGTNATHLIFPNRVQLGILRCAKKSEHDLPCRPAKCLDSREQVGPGLCIVSEVVGMAVFGTLSLR
jgi:hypothetical protein